VRNSVHVICKFLFLVLARKERGRGKKGGGKGGNNQFVISRATNMSLLKFKTSTIKLKNTMGLKSPRVTRIWEKRWVISSMDFHQHSANRAQLSVGKTNLDKL